MIVRVCGRYVRESVSAKNLFALRFVFLCLCVMYSSDIISIHVKKCTMWRFGVICSSHSVCGASCGEQAAALSLHGNSSVGVSLRQGLCVCVRFYFCDDQF